MLTLDSINLDFSSWSLQRREERKALWTDSDGDILAINYIPGQPDIPPPSQGAVGLRAYFRNQCTKQGSGIVEADVVRLHGIDCVRLVIKARQKPVGFTFQGTCVIPRQDFSFVVRIQALERGATGMREAAVMMVELPNPEYEPPPGVEVDPLVPDEDQPRGKIKGWFKDPYDPQFDAIALRTLADDERHDESYPKHPLSRVRQKMRSILQTLQFSPEILQAPGFEG
jgi:hypothetical protein